MIKVFKKALGGLRAELKLADGVETRHFENLFLAEVKLVNKGDKDIEQFSFGITLSDGDNLVYIQFESPDRHHNVIEHTPVALGAPAPQIDLSLAPFNRRDSYIFKLFLVIPPDNTVPGNIILGSPHSVRFEDLETIYNKYRISFEYSPSSGLLIIPRRRIPPPGDD